MGITAFWDAMPAHADPCTIVVAPSGIKIASAKLFTVAMIN
jgi:hypothetical protein